MGVHVDHRKGKDGSREADDERWRRRPDPHVGPDALDVSGSGPGPGPDLVPGSA